MPPLVALVAFVGLIAWLMVRDVRRRPTVSNASWLVLLWIVICSSRPVSEWFQSGRAATVDSYLEGSPADRAVFIILILATFIVLLRRGISFPDVIDRNRWLFAFYGYCLVSVLWSDYPFVAFKRLFKDFGSVIMVLALLTERDPLDAIRAAFVRAAYLLVPMSVLFIRFYPELGRRYTGYSQNDLMYVGVGTHKNTLGALLVVSIVFLAWDLMSRRTASSTQTGRFDWMDSAGVLWMALWLLIVADSATAVICTIVGIGVLLGTGVGRVKRWLPSLEIYAITGAALWFLLDSVLHINELVVTSLGRDMTLTSRTGAWEVFMNVDINPLIGAGFKSFWAGERMAQMWDAVGGQIVQAHNGYIETYLEGGVLGLVLLLCMLWSGLRKIKKPLVQGDAFARLRLAFWLLALFYNFSEASFTQIGIFWLITLLVITESPNPVLSAPVAAATEGGGTRTSRAVAPQKWVLNRPAAATADALNRSSNPVSTPDALGTRPMRVRPYEFHRGPAGNAAKRGIL